eukprot:CAMPEP_0178954186 /NCGR_PEP_ID=MMETSP0789-20121207/8847_1 /TAXON_ID=3005 /ORGANISM="Rhizosolenia setigera, Strain CCMP 1694" /LENGTH=486 /DNA_ID=CAMNT_0020635553 /DNA_START=82 /DNA_END=1542 /DNA_ORIENTATION=+
MKLVLLPLTAVSMLLGATAFAPNGSPTAFVSRLASSENVLYMSTKYDYTTKYSATGSYGIEGGKPKKKDEFDPEESITAYLSAPDSVAAKSNLDGSVLVSGWVNTRERSDQFVFDLLNHEDSAFQFDKIVAFVDDMKFAKKRLLSRSARYTGLLDKLDFLEASSSGELPTLEQLSGIKHWVANVEAGDLSKVQDIAQLCKQASVENVSILLSGANGLDAAASVSAIQALDTSDTTFAVVSVGEFSEIPEGSLPYDISDFGTEEGVVPLGVTYSRDEAIRAVTDSLQLESGSNKAMTFTECASTNTTENIGARLVKGLREAGYTRPQEIDHMISKGVAAYEKAIADYKQAKWEKENPDPEKLKAEEEEREKEAAIAWKKTEQEFEERKKNEIEENARAWAKREYFRKSMGGNMGMTEEEYIESVWERAMFEGDLKYRMMHGGETDERKELAEFLDKQDKKKEIALRKAQEAMKGLVPSGDDDDDDEE